MKIRMHRWHVSNVIFVAVMTCMILRNAIKLIYRVIVRIVGVAQLIFTNEKCRR